MTESLFSLDRSTTISTRIAQQMETDKKNARKEKSFERKDMCKTGGGLPATRKRLLHPSLVDVVLGIISELSVEGDKNSVDSNAG